MKTTHLFAVHGHFGADRGVLALVIFAAAALLIAFWPDKSQTK